jgi:uncharacterized protein
MAATIAAHPELYAADPNPEPVLKGARCRACGYVFFPPQSYGCESCGAPPAELEPRDLTGRGALQSFATVHVHHGKGIEVPFTIGVIALDDGPIIRSVLAERTDEGLHIGDRMHSTLVADGADDKGNNLIELRFTRENSK